MKAVIMAGGSVVFDLIVSGLAGYVLSRLKPKGTKLMLTLIFWIMLMPGTMRTVPLYMEFKSMPLLGINLLETFWPIWLMAGANAFNIILFKNFFDGISESLVEAAWIDGCSDIMLFFKIIIPLSVPVFITVAMILFAFTTLIGNLYYVDKCIFHIFGKKPGKVFMSAYYIVASAVIFVGAGLSADLLWGIADVTMGAMTIINMPVILLLGKYAYRALRDYEAQRKAGKEPIFKSKYIDLPDKTDFWN